MQVDLLERASVAAAPLRQAAMLLHSMGDADRRWMLERLDAAQRPRIEALLAELRALEFPIDAALVRESLAGTVTTPVGAAAQPTALSGWGVDQSARVLTSEPDDVIALLLRAGQWPWAPGLRTRLGAERVRRIDASRYSQASDLSPALLDAAVRAAGDRFALLGGEAPAGRDARKPAMTRRVA